MSGSNKKKTDFVTALVANAAGEIFELDGYAALGMEGLTYTPLRTSNTCNMPYGSELMYLPDRRPILFNMRTAKIETLSQNPYISDEPLFPVSAFNSPGYVISHLGAYVENKKSAIPAAFFIWSGGLASGKISIGCYACGSGKAARTCG